MLTISYPVRSGDIVLPERGPPVIRIRPQEDGSVMMTNIGAGHTAPVVNQAEALIKAERILRMLRAGSRR